LTYLTIKFLADANIEKGIVEYLRTMQYDVKWVPEYNATLSDTQLLRIANKEKRILITNDKDFGELIFLQKKLTTGIILFRIKGQKTSAKIHLIKRIFQYFNEKLLHHFIVITSHKIRFINLKEDYERKKSIKKNRG
jgi:predicted nuclease of predicted toxin-antitoxin system